MKIDYDCINYNALRIVQNENDDVLKRRMDGDKDLLAETAYLNGFINGVLLMADAMKEVLKA